MGIGEAICSNVTAAVGRGTPSFCEGVEPAGEYAGRPPPPVARKAIISSGKYYVYSGTCMPAAEQYVVDENGNKVAVILPIREYEHLREDLHDLAMVAERRDEATINLAELKKRVM
jgi:hypothetical protein